jgi:hypothetical protein
MRRKTKKQGPGIFTPWKMVGAVLTFGPVLLWILLVTAIVPDEVIPRVEIGPNGTTDYHLQGLEDAVLGATWPAVLAVAGYFGLRFAVRKQLRRHGLDDINWSGEPRWGIAILAILGSFFLLIVFISVVVVPFKNSRTVITGPDSIEFRSLYWSWTIERDELEEVYITQELRRGRGGLPLHDIHLVVITKAGARYKTMGSSWATMGVKPEDLEAHMRVLEALERDLRK